MPRGLKPIRKRLADGSVRIYWYHRATGKRLQHDPETAEGFVEVAGLDALANTAKAVSGPLSGSYAELWAEYKASPDWRNLSPRTRADYQAVRDWLGPAADVPHTAIDRPGLVRLRDRAVAEKGRRFGNYVIQVVRLTFGWALERGKVKANPAMGMKLLTRPANARKVNRAWSRDELVAYMTAAPFHLLVPVVLALCAGPRQGNTLRIPRGDYRDGQLTFTHTKNGEDVALKVDGLLRAVLDEAVKDGPEVGPIALNSFGEPWSQSGFRASFFKLLRRLERDGKVRRGCTFHGLRHTVVAMARDAGESDVRAAAAIGDRTATMAAVYGQEADFAAARTDILGAIQQQFANIQWKPRTAVSNPVVSKRSGSRRNPL